MSVPLLFILLLFSPILVFGARLWSLEIKIMKRLKVIDHAQWQELIWWFGSRANPFRFRKYVETADASDPLLNLYIKNCKRIRHFTFLSIAVFAIATIGATVIGIALNLMNS